jgi:NTE family protein
MKSILLIPLLTVNTQYERMLITAMKQVQENQHLHIDDWQRTLCINTLDVKTTDFKLSNDKKAALLQEGIKGAENYYQWFEDPEKTPVNRLYPFTQRS